MKEAANLRYLQADRADAAIADLQPVTVESLPDFLAATTAGAQQGFGYYFPYLLARAGEKDSAAYLGEDNGSLCIFLRRRRRGRPHLELFAAPVPMEPTVALRALERANDHNGDFSARIMRIDEKDVSALQGLHGLRVRERKKQYVYAPRSFSDLSGRRYRTLRRNIAVVEERQDVSVRTFKAEHRAACLELLARWRARHRTEHNSAGGAGTTRRILELADQLPERVLRGEVVFVNGQLCAFSFGGEIRPGVACYCEAKNDFGVPGLSYFLRRSFLAKLTDFDLVNDGSDTGRRGLKQLKDSLRPVAMHGEFRASQGVSRP